MANKVLYSNNFTLVGYQELSSNPAYLEREDVYYDSRTEVLVEHLDTSNLQWYYNYIDLNRMFSIRNPKAYPIFMLDLGYVPVIYLPSCCSSIGPTWFGKLDESGLKYVKMAATSFTVKFCSINTIDAWVSKIDASEFLGMRVEDVTSKDIIRRIFDV